MENSELLSLTLLLQAVVKKRRAVLLIVLAGSILSLGTAFLLPRVYTAEATILPSGDMGPMGALSDALDLVNLDMGMEISASSSFLFPTILESVLIRDQLLDSTVEYRGSRKTLSAILGQKSREKSREKLSRMVKVLMDKKTGIIRIRATSRRPELSYRIVDRLVRLLEEFNKDKRRIKAGLDYEFILEELKTTDQELLQAEESLTRFEKNNRDCFTTTNPGVRMEHERLLQNLRLQHEIYIELVKQVELADIERNKINPIVKLLDPPSVPTIKSGPPRKVIALAGGFTTLIIALLGPVLAQLSLSTIWSRIMSG
ncbi:MAG: hypothetical protein JXB45_12770 [Candidatus Krumholzibacteriota bacterium]|nr:hypothetical protein [Candidatus Krumholzibacteriota bacterium]